MDCNHARAFLDRIADEFPDHADPECTAAAAHLQDCISCAKLLHDRQAQDLLLGEICRSVPLPPELEERLLQAVDRELSGAAELSPLAEKNPLTPAGRRRRLSRRTAFVAAGLLCLAAGIWFWKNSTIDLDELAALAVQSLVTGQNSPLFDGPFDPEELFPQESLHEPHTLELHAYRRLPGAPRDCDAAITYFSFINRRGRMVNGALLIVPTAQISEPPSARGMAAAATEYRKNGFYAKSWRSRGYVYLCIVGGGEESLLELQRNSGGQTI